MTVLGKILVILNLVFALVVGGLVVVVYSRSTNWEQAFKRADEQAKAARAAADFYAEEVKKAHDAAKTYEGDADKNVQEKDKVVEDFKRQVADARDKSDKAEKLAADVQRQVIVAQTDVAAAQEHVKVLEASNQKLTDLNKQALVDYNKLNQEATTYQLEAKALRDRNLVITKQLKQAEEMIKQKGTTTTVSNVGVGTAPSLPPENVEGRVTQVDEQHGLLAISIGSDSNIEKGQTLDAWRIEGNNTKYLGTVKIMDVRAKESVARPDTKQVQLKVGDYVGLVR